MKLFTKKMFSLSCLLMFLSLLLCPTVISYAQTTTQATSAIVPIGNTVPKIQDYTLLAPLPCIDNDASCSNGVVKTVTFVRYINLMFKLAIALSGVFAVFVIVMGGFQYLSTDSIYGKSEGKEKIWRAIEGLIMVLASYLILYTINPKYVQLDPNVITPLNLKEIKGTDIASLQQMGLENIQTQANTVRDNALKEAARLRTERDAAYADGFDEDAAGFEADAVEQEKIAIKADAQGTANVNYQKILNNVGDASNANALAEIKKDKAAMDKAYDDGIYFLKNKGGVTTELEQEKISADLTADQMVLVQQINDKLANGAGKNDIAAARELKKQYLDTTTVNLAKVTDPVQAEALRVQAVADLKSIDATIAHREKCQSDKIYHPLKIAVGFIGGGLSGGVITAYSTTEPCQ